MGITIKKVQVFKKFRSSEVQVFKDVEILNPEP
jgi:hypothetical protein